MKKMIIKEPIDALLMVWRRRWWVLLSILPLAVIAFLVAILLPSIYVSETLILVESRDVPEDVVRDLVTLDVSERLTALQQKILSRTNLNRIINEFPQAFEELRQLNPEQQVERLRSRIEVEVTTGRRGSRTVVPYFRVSYGDTDPALAQRVTARVAELFVTEDARTQEEQVLGTTEFLRQQVEQRSAELSRLESQLASLKERYRYELPDQLDANLRTLDRLNSELQQLRDDRARYVTSKLELEQRLSETPSVLSREELRRQSQLASGQDPLVAELQSKERALSELLTRYTERHPDVARLEAQIAKLKEEIPPEALIEADPLEVAQSRVSHETNPVYQQLTAQLDRLNTEMELLENREQELRAAIARYAQRVENAPQREQEVAVIQRQYDNLMRSYRSLQDNLDAARLSSSAMSSRRNENLQIVDPASYPLSPSKPNRLLVLLAGLGIAGAVGIGLGVLVDFLDQRVWSTGEVTQLLGLPVIGEIPEIVSPEEVKARSRRGWLKAGAYAMLVFAGAVSVFITYSTPELRNRGIETMSRLLGW